MPIQDHSPCAAILTSSDICRVFLEFLACGPLTVCASVCQIWHVEKLNVLAYIPNKPYKPKAPQTAYSTYAADVREEVKSKYFGASVTNISKTIARLWNNEPEVLKDKYRNEYVENGKFYAKVLEIWAKKHEAWTKAQLGVAYFCSGTKLLQWAKKQGCPWDENTCATAAGSGLEVLQWARDRGCPWDEKTCMEAAAQEDIESLEWAHEHGCDYDGCDGCIFVTTHGHMDAKDMRDRILDLLKTNEELRKENAELKKENAKLNSFICDTNANSEETKIGKNI